MPGMSALGKLRPTSMMRMRSSSSTQAMLRPTSPTPPRKTTRTFASEETGILQRLANTVALFGSGRHQWEAGDAGRQAEHLERGFQRDRVGRDEERVEQRAQRLVDLPRCCDVAGLDEVDH